MGTKKKLKEKNARKQVEHLALMEHLDWVSDSKKKKAVPSEEANKLMNKKSHIS